MTHLLRLFLSLFILQHSSLSTQHSALSPQSSSLRGSVATGLPSSLCCILLISVVGVMGSFLSGCDYGRMFDQDVIKTYGEKMPEMDARTIPVQDGFQGLINADPQTLKNPRQYSKASVEQGAQAYAYYCVQCHGPKADGNGTVGQSFVPLPADLASEPVQAQSDGELYAKIRLGFKRHPRLFTTLFEEEGWALINYIRSLNRKNG
jgi:mono/diheme cytochrome c family protein